MQFSLLISDNYNVWIPISDTFSIYLCMKMLLKDIHILKKSCKIETSPSERIPTNCVDIWVFLFMLWSNELRGENLWSGTLVRTPRNDSFGSICLNSRDCKLWKTSISIKKMYLIAPYFESCSYFHHFHPKSNPSSDSYLNATKIDMILLSFFDKYIG